MCLSFVFPPPSCFSNLWIHLFCFYFFYFAINFRCPLSAIRTCTVRCKLSAFEYLFNWLLLYACQISSAQTSDWKTSRMTCVINEWPDTLISAGRIWSLHCIILIRKNPKNCLFSNCDWPSEYSPPPLSLYLSEPIYKNLLTYYIFDGEHKTIIRKNALGKMIKTSLNEKEKIGE